MDQVEGLLQGVDTLGILAGGEEGEDVQSHLSRGHVCGDKRGQPGCAGHPKN